jgi:hypothetical protein
MTFAADKRMGPRHQSRVCTITSKRIVCWSPLLICILANGTIDLQIAAIQSHRAGMDMAVQLLESGSSSASGVLEPVNSQLLAFKKQLAFACKEYASNSE